MNKKNIFKSIIVILAFVLMTTTVFAQCEKYKDWENVESYSDKKANDVGLKVTEMTVDKDNFVAKTTGLCDKDYHYFAIVFFNNKTHRLSIINSKISDIMYHEDKMDAIAEGKTPREFSRKFCLLEYGSTTLTSPLNCAGNSKFLLADTSDSAPVVFLGKMTQKTTDEMTYSIKTSKILKILSDKGITYEDLISRYDSVAFYVTRYNKGASGFSKDIGDNTASQTGWKHEYLAQMSEKSCYTWTELPIVGKGSGVVTGMISGAGVGAGIGAIFGGIGAIPGTIAGTIIGGIGGGVADLLGAKVTLAKSNLYLKKACMFSGPNLEAGYKSIKLSPKKEEELLEDEGNKNNSVVSNEQPPSGELPKEEPQGNSVKPDSSLDTPTIVIQTLNVLPMVSEIKYKLAKETNYKTARKINDSGIFLVNDLDKDKDIQITLPSQFTEGDLYALVRQSDDATEDTINEIKNVLATNDLKLYALNDNFDITNIVNSSKLNKIKYTLGSDITFKFKAKNTKNSSTTEFIFMQPSGNTLNVTSAVLYLFDNEQQSQFQLCELNKKIIKLYCKGLNCNNLDISCLPKGGLTAKVTCTPTDTGKPEECVSGLLTEIDPPAKTDEPEEPVGITPARTNGKCSIDTQKTVEEYITCLRNNIETVDLTTRKYEFVNIDAPIVIGNKIIDQKYNSLYYSENNLCFTNTTYNNAIFEAAKNANLTEEETAQLWGLISTESECDVTVKCGDACNSHGIGQVNETWNDYYSYNSIKPYLVQINSSKYDSFEKYKDIFKKIKDVKNRDYNDQVSSVEISIAINKYHKSLIVNTSKNANRPFTDDLDKIYDHDDAIDLFFANGYIYSGGVGEYNSRVAHFKDGIKIGATRYQGIVYPALRKVGFYLNYKHMIYNCHKTEKTNAFVNAYKNKFNGTYCK